MESNVVSFQASEEKHGSEADSHHVIARASTPVSMRARKTAHRPPLPTAQVYYLEKTRDAVAPDAVQANPEIQVETKIRLTDLVFKSKTSKADEDPFVKRLSRLS